MKAARRASRRSLRASAEGLYGALLNEVRRMKEQIALVEQSAEES